MAQAVRCENCGALNPADYEGCHACRQRLHEPRALASLARPTGGRREYRVLRWDGEQWLDTEGELGAELGAVLASCGEQGWRVLAVTGEPAREVILERHASAIDRLVGRRVQVWSVAASTSYTDQGWLEATDGCWLCLRAMNGDLLYLPIHNLRLVKPLDRPERDAHVAPTEGEEPS